MRVVGNSWVKRRRSTEGRRASGGDAALAVSLGEGMKGNLKIVKYDRPGLAFVTITPLSSAFKIYYITLKSLGVITISLFI